MTLIKSKGSIEEKIRREARDRAAIRRQEDIHRGLTRSTEAQRGDFDKTKKFDKLMGDYRRFKNPNDRKEITNAYFQAQRESRK